MPMAGCGSARRSVTSLGGWLPRGVYLPCSMGSHPLLGAVLALPRAGGPAEALTGIAFDSYVTEFYVTEW